MTEIVTLEEAKLYIRVDSDHEDEIIIMLIEAASEAVMAVADAWDRTTPAPNRLKLAVLARVSVAFDNRDKIVAADGEDSLLNPLRNLRV